MNVDAVTAWVDRLERCQNQLSQLGQLVDSQGKIAPEQIDWQHVDSLLWISEFLQQAIDSISRNTVKRNQDILHSEHDWESLI